MDILAAIDAAVGCQQCGGALDGSVSDDFCSQDCQRDWTAQHAEPLVGYQEPWHRPWDFPGVGTEAAVSGQAHRYARGSYLPLPSMAPGTAFIDRGNGWEELGRLRDGFTITAHSNGLTPTNWIVDETQGWTAPPVPVPTEFRLPRSTGNLYADWRALRMARSAATTDAQRAACDLRCEDLNRRQAAMWSAMAGAIATGFTAFSEHLGQVWESLNREVFVPFARQYLDGTVTADHAPRDDPRERALAARRNRNTGPGDRRRAPRRIDAPGSRR